MIAGPSAYISHANEDAAVAYDLCRHLERAGIPCWIAPRDVTPGQDYASEIVVGIESCSAFVLVLSAAANRSPFVRREVERAASKGKAMFPVRIEDVLPERALEFFVSSSHWIDAATEPRDAQWARIARAIKGEREGPGGDGDEQWRQAARGSPAWRKPSVAAIGVLGAALLAGLWLMSAGDGDKARDSPPGPTGADTGGTSSAAPSAPASTPPPSPALATATSAAAAEPCPERYSTSPDLPSPFTCVCSVEAAHDGTVWGSDIYTSDSHLCRAARHAGAIPAGGGTVTVERVPGRDLYPGTRRHGVATHDYGHFPESIHFAGTAQPPTPEPCPQRLSVNPDLETPFSCVCSGGDVSSGTVWGTDIYTADSSICRAALHAGKLTAAGGQVTIDYLDGRDGYAGSRRNGVGTHDYGPYAASIAFR